MTPRTFSAPGRVNLIGEHTDYTGGFVLPAAIAYATRVTAAVRNDRRVVVRSAGFPGAREFDLAHLATGVGHDWSDRVRGMLVELQRSGRTLRGAEVAIESDVPIGAGLSSSASVMIAAGWAFLSLADEPIDATELARVAQRAENEHAGARTGIMDPFISAHARRGDALLIDTRSLRFDYVPLPVRATVVICNTMVKHDHATGGYNARRAECAAGTALLHGRFPAVESLRDATLEQLQSVRAVMRDDVFSRCRHVIGENDRTQRAARALAGEDLAAFGTLMDESHRSLRDAFVSCRRARRSGPPRARFSRRRLRRANDGRRLRRLRHRARRHDRSRLVHGVHPGSVSCGDRRRTRRLRRRRRGRRGRSPSVTGQAWLGRPHRRYNPLLREWVLVSPQRTARPWQGETGPADGVGRPAYDPACYLCPGNARAGGERNPDYGATYVFENDFAALVPQSEPASFDDAGLFVAQTERGRARVVCFSPRHDLSIGRMTTPAIRAVIDAWAAEYERLGADAAIASITIFENRGDAMGASNPHPHAQIWANERVPNLPAREGEALGAYARDRDACLLCTYVHREVALGERLVYANDQAAAVVPFWAVWPFETLLVPRRHVASLERLADEERDGLADAMRVLVAAYDRVFDVPFPYSMGFHQRPTTGEPHDEWHLHAHYVPPLLRSATVRKYMVGYELLAMPQRDITPEHAAERLRGLVAALH